MGGTQIRYSSVVSASRQPRRGVYLLPAVFTTGNLLAGYFCIIESARSHFDHAALLIVLAGVLDTLDGRIARLTATTSEFGEQYDSLADIVSFGLAPALLAYFWALTPLRRIGWLVAFLFVVCAATRLARFNIQKGSADKRWFVGLPSPAAAGAIASLVLAVGSADSDPSTSVFAAVVVAGVAALMVSRYRYRAFKDLNLRIRRSSVWVLVIAAALVAILAEPRFTLLAMAVVYVGSAPVTHLFGLVRRRARAAPEREVPDDAAAR